MKSSIYSILDNNLKKINNSEFKQTSCRDLKAKGCIYKNIKVFVFQMGKKTFRNREENELLDMKCCHYTFTL